jgi:hypothetical protein
MKALQVFELVWRVGIRPCNAGGHLFYGIVIPDTATIGSLAMESNDIADEAQFDVSDKGLVRRRKGRQAQWGG